MPHHAERYSYRRWPLLTLLATSLGAGCASNPAPNDWLPSASEVPTDPFGAWIRIDFDSGTSSHQAEGELLAVEPDTVYLLAGEQVVAFPGDRIRHARVAWFESGAGGLAAWTALGSLASLSNGVIAGITLPLWIITGSLATGAQTRAPLVDYDPGNGSLLRIRAYARFPQGFPDGLDRSTLIGRPNE